MSSFLVRSSKRAVSLKLCTSCLKWKGGKLVRDEFVEIQRTYNDATPRKAAEPMIVRTWQTRAGWESTDTRPRCQKYMQVPMRESPRSVAARPTIPQARWWRPRGGRSVLKTATDTRNLEVVAHKQRSIAIAAHAMPAQTLHTYTRRNSDTKTYEKQPW